MSKPESGENAKAVFREIPYVEPTMETYDVGDAEIQEAKKQEKFWLTQLWNIDHGRFFVDDVVKLIGRLGMESEKSSKKFRTWYGKFLRKWNTEEMSNYSPTIDRLELMAIFDELDLEKDLLMIVPDAEYRRVTCLHYATNCIFVYFRKSDVETFLFPWQAVYLIFRELVVGIDWTSIQCHPNNNCSTDAKLKVLELMKKFGRIDNSLTIPSLKVLKEARFLRRKLCFFRYRINASDVDYFFTSVKYGNWIPKTDYTEIVSQFNLPIDDGKEYVGKQTGMDQNIDKDQARAWCMYGWAVQFFKAEPELEDLLNAVLCAIGQLMQPQLRSAAMTYLKANAVAGSSPKLDSAYSRDIAPTFDHGHAECDSANLQPSRIRNEATVMQELFLRNYTYAALKHCQFEKKLYKWQLVICEGRVYTCNISLLGDLKSPFKYFPINVAEFYRKASGANWCQSSPYLTQRHLYNTEVKPDEIVVRSVQSLACLTPSDEKTRIFYGDLIDVVSSELMMRNNPKKEMSEKLLSIRCQYAIPEDHVCITMSVHKFKDYLKEFHIDNSSITIIPDVIQKQSALHGISSFYQTIFTLTSDGLPIMSWHRAFAFLIENLVLGIDWREVIEMNGLESLQNYKLKLTVVLMKLCNIQDKSCWIKKDYLDEIIADLLNNVALKNIEKTLFVDLDFDTPGTIPIETVNSECEQSGLICIPDFPEYHVCQDWQARNLVMLSWLFTFYEDSETTEKISSEHRRLIRFHFFEGLVDRVPRGMEDTYNENQKRLLDYWTQLEAKIPEKTTNQEVIAVEKEQEATQELKRKKKKNKNKNKKKTAASSLNSQKESHDKEEPHDAEKDPTKGPSSSGVFVTEPSHNSAIGPDSSELSFPVSSETDLALENDSKCSYAHEAFDPVEENIPVVTNACEENHGDSKALVDSLKPLPAVDLMERIKMLETALRESEQRENMYKQDATTSKDELQAKISKMEEQQTKHLEQIQKRHDDEISKGKKRENELREKMEKMNIQKRELELVKNTLKRTKENLSEMNKKFSDSEQKVKQLEMEKQDASKKMAAKIEELELVDARALKMREKFANSERKVKDLERENQTINNKIATEIDKRESAVAKAWEMETRAIVAERNLEDFIKRGESQQNDFAHISQLLSEELRRFEQETDYRLQQELINREEHSRAKKNKDTNECLNCDGFTAMLLSLENFKKTGSERIEDLEKMDDSPKIQELVHAERKTLKEVVKRSNEVMLRNFTNARNGGTLEEPPILRLSTEFEAAYAIAIENQKSREKESSNESRTAEDYGSNF